MKNSQKNALYNSLMKNIKAGLNEALIRPNFTDSEIAASDRLNFRNAGLTEKERALKNYVVRYYEEFPEELESDIAEGQSHINWGELEGYGNDLANNVCDFINMQEFEGKKLTKSQQEFVDLAWEIADEYVRQHC